MLQLFRRDWYNKPVELQNRCLLGHGWVFGCLSQPSVQLQKGWLFQQWQLPLHCTAWHKHAQIHINTYSLMCMHMLEQKHPHTCGHMHIMAVEWWRRGGISIMTQSYLSNYRRPWHWSISLLWWAERNCMLANTGPQVHTKLQRTVFICILLLCTYTGTCTETYIVYMFKGTH